MNDNAETCAIAMKLTNDLRRLRRSRYKRRRLTLQTVSMLTGISMPTLSRIEHGSNALLVHAFVLAKFYGKRIEKIWYYVEERDSEKAAKNKRVGISKRSTSHQKTFTKMVAPSATVRQGVDRP